MKRCPYCGKEYPEAAVQCSIDAYLLPTTQVATLPLGAEAIALPVAQAREDSESMSSHPAPTKADQTNLIYPDYQWSARDAWKCLVMIPVFWALFAFVLGLVFAVLDMTLPRLHHWRSGGIAYFWEQTTTYTLCLAVAAYFARTETLASFWKGFGLNRKPTEFAWFGIAMALLLRLVGHYVITHRWGRGVFNPDLSAFRHSAGLQRYLFLAPMVVLAPLFEEAINRGFLYRAFRKSYPLWAGMALLVAWTAFAHWSQYSHSWIAAIDLSLLTVVQCYLRERSDSLWDCILCHMAFNGSLLFVWGVFR